MRSDCQKKAKCGHKSYSHCVAKCPLRKSDCEHLKSKKARKLTEEEKGQNYRAALKNYEEVSSKIKHKKFDLNNPPPDSELIPEQIYAKEMWNQDMVDWGLKKN